MIRNCQREGCGGQTYYDKKENTRTCLLCARTEYLIELVSDVNEDNSVEKKYIKRQGEDIKQRVIDDIVSGYSLSDTGVRHGLTYEDVCMIVRTSDMSETTLAFIK